MFCYNFHVTLVFCDIYEHREVTVYAKNTYSAFRAVFKELGPYRYNVNSISIYSVY